jgi:uncharacterized protein
MSRHTPTRRYPFLFWALVYCDHRTLALPNGLGSTTMETSREAVLLRIFVGENHRYHHRPLYEAIVLKAREMGLAGATVLRGPLGFGKSSRLHLAKPFRFSTDLPMVIELVDNQEKIEAFLPAVDSMIDSGLVTLERAEVVHNPQVPVERR